MKRFVFPFALLTATLASPALGSSHAADAAQGYPEKPIRVIVPFPPGGGTDIVARLIGPKLAELLGQPVIIENRAGAGGTIGSGVAAKAAPDGYTLGFATSSTHGVAPSLYKNLPYDAIKDFAPVALVVTAPFMLAVKKDLPVASVQDLIALAKKRPGELNYASAGIGSSNQLTMEMFKLMTGVNIVHVPYKGSGPALTDLVGGQVDLVINDMASLMSFVKNNQVKPIAVTSLKRNPQMPDLPTIDESGVSGYSAVAWYGLLAPQGTPPAIVTKLNQATRKVLLDPDVRQRLVDLSFEIRDDGPDQFREFMVGEVKKWAAVIKEANVRVE